MPIILYPIDQPATSTTACDAQLTVAPEVAVIEGREITARAGSLVAVQGQLADVRWTMRNRQGDVVDLSACGFSSSSESSSSAESATGSTIKLRIQEILSGSSGNQPIEIDGSVVNSVAGLVTAKLTDDVVKDAGIFRIEWAVLDADGAIVFTNQGYLLVERGLFGAVTSKRGPISIPELRLHLRDNGPSQDNFLIDESEFSISEIIGCMERPVLYFNEASPPIDRKYTTKNFPYRFNWLNGTCAGLYTLAAAHYRRNAKQIEAAGGVNLNDKTKAMEYEQKGQELWAEYKRWTQTQKASLNAEACFGGTSECGRGGW